MRVLAPPLSSVEACPLHQIKIKKVIPKTNLAVKEPKILTTKAQPSASSSSKKSVFDDGSFDPKTKEKLENYFVPRGRTVVSNYSTTSPLIPSSEDSRESYQPADSSDIDVITGATAQLCWKPKTLPGPLGADILKNFNPRIHPILQGLKNQLDGRNQAEERNDNDMMILCLETAKSFLPTVQGLINLNQFRSIYGDWDILKEWEEYQSGPKHRRYLRARGEETTPTPAPESTIDWSPTPPPHLTELPTLPDREKVRQMNVQPSGYQPMVTDQPPSTMPAQTAQEYITMPPPLYPHSCQDSGLTPNQRKRKASKPNPTRDQGEPALPPGACNMHAALRRLEFAKANSSAPKPSATSATDEAPKRPKQDKPPSSTLLSNARPDRSGPSLSDRISSPNQGARIGDS
ncbi:hypothetical protein PTTG_29980 [Puccinia triticina 1-1 BBBD Race 1]|uniref:Uncharacterized protein n=1 Tax=Puccinia triticina (isolate 1-1 / race 1 (BBBD)) TaxID=630390 RepID=A0A180G108_PUCT1|nr:hypothetical protein PTTG_29980 [Puccinia triticina 1-1 BBBD Race 1]